MSSPTTSSRCWSSALARSSIARNRAIALAALLGLAAGAADAALPSEVRQAFRSAGIPLSSVAVAVQRIGERAPRWSHRAGRAVNPASVMKLVTTFAALELLGPDYRWKTEAYLTAPVAAGRLEGDLILKGYGDPKITVEQWQSLIGALRERGLTAVDGDLVLDRSRFRVPPHDAARFDGEPFKPYNVGPDALLVNFKSVRLVFGPNASGDAVAVRVEPPLASVTAAPLPALMPGECGDWRNRIAPQFADDGRIARLAFLGVYAAACSERDWNVAVLDHPHYVHAMFRHYFRVAGGSFDGDVRDGRVPAGAVPFATLESPPLSEIVRDVNKLSNNVMARQVFLTLGTVGNDGPATTLGASRSVQRWLARRKLPVPGLVLDNGSGLSRRERITAGGLARLLVAADASAVREAFVASLAVAAIDGTVARRFHDGDVAGQALLKTGSLEGVRSLAGYVTDIAGARWAIVAIVNDPAAADALPALDFLVRWVHRGGSAGAPALH
jgi:D-alanyl-D-alanine carboxypeptidase/D-alanyl-D-alanine-endopeptidase (penicillin-binding protein 4)